jgi:hypothetical protein
MILYQKINDISNVWLGLQDPPRIPVYDLVDMILINFSGRVALIEVYQADVDHPIQIIVWFSRPRGYFTAGSL